MTRGEERREELREFNRWMWRHHPVRHALTFPVALGLMAYVVVSDKLRGRR